MSLSSTVHPFEIIIIIIIIITMMMTIIIITRIIIIISTYCYKPVTDLSAYKLLYTYIY